MNKRPPKWADRLLEWFCSEEQIEILQGDLHELFEWRVEEMGIWLARLHYIKDVVDMLRPFALKKKRTTRFSNRIDMFRNNLKISFRSLLKQKTNSLINISGLALGMAVCLLISIYISHELDHDKFSENYDRIYRVTSHWGDFSPRSKTAMPVGPALKQDIPGIANSVRFMKVLTNDNSGIPIKYRDKKFAEEGLVSVDKGFLEMFSIEVVLGDATSALDDPDNIMLSEEMADKYFGDRNPIGEVLRVEDKFEMKVTGVFKSVNHKSHLYFDFITPITFMSEGRWGIYTFTQNWETTFGWTYIQLEELVDPTQVEALLPEFVANRYPENFGEDYGGFELFLQSLTDIHLRSDYTREIRENGDIRLLVQMAIIGIVILLVAAINFINLSTARSTLRAKEVGVRKTMGALKGQLIRQFMVESFLVTFIALLLAIGLAILALPRFNMLMQKEFIVEPAFFVQMLANGVILSASLAILAGLYPAFVLSGFQPVRVLKGGFISSREGGLLRKIFTTVQFATGIVFLFGLYVIYDQLQFIQTKEIGLDTSQVLVINRPPQSVKNEVIVNALKQIPVVELVSAAAGSVPGYDVSGATWSYHPEGFPRERRSMNTMWGYNDVVKTFGMEMVAGTDFSSVHDKDSLNALILNASAVASLGWTSEEAIGKSMGEFHWRQDQITPGRVVGVVKDFHFESLHEEVKPGVLLYTNNDFGNLIVKLNSYEGSEAIEAIEKTWNEVLPEFPFQVTFLDEKVAGLYAEEERLRQSINYFAVIAIFTSALGLLGLVSFVLMQRSKEIGIRKVLGAKTMILVKTLSSDFVRLIAIAFLISAPVAYYLMDQWLAGFAFSIDIGILPFVFALAAIAAICALTVGYKALKAAMTNPVEILREE
ncbi:MAG: FtsX-like permease family protein [Roseivirga sp.]|nr:FtsX-like permease family protein [Roseivirga sp.]